MPTEIKIDTKSVTKYLDDIAKKQLPFAVATALNATAKLAAAEANAAMPSVFARANRFTQAGAGTPSLATKTNLTATIGIKRLQARYLGLEIYGGTRTPP